jgi:hypothetical protein
MGVRSGGFASGMRVVVDMVWNVWTMVVFSSSLRVGLLGLWGASRRDSSEVLVSGTSAEAGGSQDGVRAKLLSGRVGSGKIGALKVFFAGEIHGDSSGTGEIGLARASASLGTTLERPILCASPSEVFGRCGSAFRKALDAQQLRPHSTLKNST